MKYYLLSGLSLLSLHSFAQLTTVGLRSEFAQISKYTYGRQSGYEGLQSFSNKEVKGSQFYFPGWSQGSLTVDSDGVAASTGYVFLYDKVRQELFMRPTDSATVLQVDKNKIKGFTLFDNNNHQFEVASVYDPANKSDFYEVLVKNDNGFSLLKSVKTKFVKFNPNDMVKMKEGDTYDEFQDDITYYVSYKHGVPQPVKLKDNSIKKALAVDKNKVDDFINANFDAERNENFLTRLISSINQ